MKDRVDLDSELESLAEQQDCVASKHAIKYLTEIYEKTQRENKDE